MMPEALANFVNTLRADVDSSRRQLLPLFQEAARLRQADERSVCDVLDELQSKISARFLDLVRSGKLRAIADLGKTPEPGIGPMRVTEVKFPESWTKET